MAGMLCSVVNSGGTSLSSGTAKTVLQIAAPTNQRAVVRSVNLAFNGTASTDPPVVIRLLYQSTAGTMTSGTVVMRGAGSETPQTTARYSATAEPTAGNVIWTGTCHPQANFRLAFAPGDVVVPGGSRLGIECTSGSSLTCYGAIEFEE